MAATAIAGKDMLLFVRKREDYMTEDASKNRFQTEHSISMEMETDSQVTKDGNLVSITDGENTVDMTSLAYEDETEVIETWKLMKQWFKNKDLVELWQANLASGKDGQNIECDYFQGYLTSFELSAAADSTVELSFSYSINGVGTEGIDLLTPDQLAAVKNAQYEYERMSAGGGPSLDAEPSEPEETV